MLRLKCSSSLIKLLFETKKTQSIGVIHLIELVLEDSNPHVRYGIVRNLCDQLVQFVYNSDTLKLLNVPTILSKIWNAIIDYSLEPNIRNYLVDFYHLLSFVNNPPLRRPSQLTQSATSTLSNFQHQDWNPLNNPTLVPSTSFNPPGMTMPFSNIPPQMLISAPNGGLSNIVPSTLANDGYNLPILGGWRNSNVSQNSGQDSIMADDTLD
uniref:Transcription initiation factor TFIID subunit 2 TPR repeats domain-containing protein n=1 Tax=Acrobeloides nanus TaxID=290746 RepID=A0A914CZ46_9BILA